MAEFMNTEVKEVKVGEEIFLNDYEKIKHIIDEFNNIKKEYTQKIKDSYIQVLKDNKLDKDVVLIETGEVGRINICKKAFSLDFEYKFYKYTKKKVLSKNCSLCYFSRFDKFLCCFRPAKGDEIIDEL